MSKIAIVTNPGNDRVLRSRAEALLREDGESPDRLEWELRRRYPRARVYEGIRDAFQQRWYVYREGRWVNDGESP